MVRIYKHYIMWALKETSEQMQLSYMTKTGLKFPLCFYSV